MTTALWIHQALSVGLRLEDLNRLSVGQVLGILIECQNDSYKYKTMATAEDIARF